MTLVDRLRSVWTAEKIMCLTKRKSNSSKETKIPPVLPKINKCTISDFVFVEWTGPDSQALLRNIKRQDKGTQDVRLSRSGLERASWPKSLEAWWWWCFWLYESGNYRNIDTFRLCNKERNLDCLILVDGGSVFFRNVQKHWLIGPHRIPEDVNP